LASPFQSKNLKLEARNLMLSFSALQEFDASAFTSFYKNNASINSVVDPFHVGSNTEPTF
jgi:hypothetical protein